MICHGACVAIITMTFIIDIGIHCLSPNYYCHLIIFEDSIICGRRYTSSIILSTFLMKMIRSNWEFTAGGNIHDITNNIFNSYGNRYINYLYLYTRK